MAYQDDDWGIQKEYDEDILAWNSIDDDELFDDDICCWDPRYKHGNYCHCAAYHEAEQRARHWFYGRWDRLVIQFWDLSIV